MSPRVSKLTEKRAEALRRRVERVRVESAKVGAAKERMGAAVDAMKAEALRALAEGATLTDIAEIVGVSVQSVSRWAKEAQERQAD